jgi:DNA-binding response OmpR family regulator
MERNQPRHVFVVDNDRVFVRLLDYVFSKDLGYRFLDFKSGEDCLRHMELGPELIVLDYKLPGMNGLDTMLEIRETHPEVKVIMLSGEGDGKLPAEFLNKGANEHVLKREGFVDALSGKIEAFLEGETQSVSGRRNSLFAWTGRKLYYVLVVIVLLLSLGYYWYL